MRNRNRLDHVLPQGYLEGFISPSAQGQLCVFDRQEKRWFASGTAGVGAIKGFYDYTEGSEPDQTADQAFAELEAKFPAVRRALVASDFSDWTKQFEFLLAFAQMLRARSSLFREQSLAQGRQLTVLRIEEIVPPEPSKTEPGKFVTPIKYAPYVPADATAHEALLRNKAITDMRTEIAKRAAWMFEMHWSLRLTQNPGDPFVTGDTPVVMEGRTTAQEEALRDRETLIFFPICWQACLVGSPAKFDRETDILSPSDLKKLRNLYSKSAVRFIFSPTQVDLDIPARNFKVPT